MSRHNYVTDKIIVTVGWDRPLSEYFGLVIDRESEECVFNTLFSNANPRCFKEIVSVTEQAAGVVLPYDLKLNVENDGYRDIGNRYIDYHTQQDGQLKIIKRSL